MAGYFKPRRGKKTTAENMNLVLQDGEFFCEVPETGVGTGPGKIKMGDGETPYAELPYLINQVSIMLTQAEYDALPDSKYTDDVTYYIVDDYLDTGVAENVTFDKAGTNLVAANVQDAIVEVNKKVDDLKSFSSTSVDITLHNYITTKLFSSSCYINGKICCFNIRLFNALDEEVGTPGRRLYASGLPKPAGNVAYFVGMDYDNNIIIDFLPFTLTSDGQLISSEIVAFEHEIICTACYIIAG